MTWLHRCLFEVLRRKRRDDLELDFSAFHRILGHKLGRQVETYLNMAFICGNQAIHRDETLGAEGELFKFR